MADSLLRWLTAWAGKRVLVLGDVCLDEYIVGRAERLSREAPVPVLEFQQRFTIPGAACSPALTIRALGGVALLAGVVGADAAAHTLVSQLQTADIDTEGIVVEAGRATTLKTRVLANHLFPQQVVRVDHQNRDPVLLRTRRALQRFLRETTPAIDAVLVSDYRSGVVDRPLMRALLANVRTSGGLVMVDSQGDFGKFRGVSLLRCNREEAESFLGNRLSGDAAFTKAAQSLARRLSVAQVVITRGSEGMTVLDGQGQSSHLPIVNPSEVYDVTGAGDTVIAVLTLALAGGAPLHEAAQLANLAAGVVVRKLGNATLTRTELLAAVQQYKQ